MDLKIYKDLYSCPQNLWPVVGPSPFSNSIFYIICLFTFYRILAMIIIVLNLVHTNRDEQYIK